MNNVQMQQTKKVTKNIKIKFKSINEIKEIKTFEYYKKYITEKK